MSPKSSRLFRGAVYCKSLKQESLRSNIINTYICKIKKGNVLVLKESVLSMDLSSAGNSFHNRGATAMNGSSP